MRIDETPVNQASASNDWTCSAIAIGYDDVSINAVIVVVITDVYFSCSLVTNLKSCLPPLVPIIVRWHLRRCNLWLAIVCIISILVIIQLMYHHGHHHSNCHGLFHLSSTSPVAIVVHLATVVVIPLGERRPQRGRTMRPPVTVGGRERGDG